MRHTPAFPAFLPRLGLTLALGFTAGCGGEPEPAPVTPAPTTAQSDPGPAAAGKDIRPIRGR